MIHIKIADIYKENTQIGELVQNLSATFDHQGRLLYSKRNTIKSFPIHSEANIPSQELVVKRFKRPIFIQCLIYSFFRSSKAARAFSNASELQKRGIKTPQAIAYREDYQHKLLKYSYLITDFTKGEPLRDFFQTPEGFSRIIARKFARFVAELHQKGILHHDLNSTNVLYHPSEQNNDYFSVIDINRMDFRESGEAITPNECFENLTRFTGAMDLFEYVLKHYIEYRNWDKGMIENAIKIKNNHDKRRIRKKKFFGKFKKSHV